MSYPEVPKGRGLKHFEKDLRAMTRDELAEKFASRSGRIVLRRLIRNIIWQAYERISVGEELGIGGNIRTFWYRWVKVVLSHMEDDDAMRGDPYDAMLEAFATMVLDWKVFRYREFDFADDNWHSRDLGGERGHVVVFAEKMGWMRWLRSMRKAFSVSVVALGGAPSALSSEYMADELLKLYGEDKTIHLIGVVDFDPAGAMIARSFQSQLERVGLKNTKLTTVIEPRHYSEDELKMFRFPSPKGQKTRNRQWIEKTGGVNGAFGLEAESLPLARTSELAGKMIVSLDE